MAYLRPRRFNSILDSKDIVVSMPYEERKHLLDKVKVLQKGGTAWWNTKQYRKYLTDNSKVFITSDGFINGYFTIWKIMRELGAVEYAIKIYFSDYQTIKPIEMKGIQAIRYREFEFEKTGLIIDDE